MSEQRELSPQEEARNNIVEFAKRYLALEMQKQQLKQDTKSLKEDFASEGVPTSVVIRVINSLKRTKKKSETELFEEECIETWLSENKDVDDVISDLISGG